MRYILKLSYCGAAFCGWQIQNHAPSVQQSLQDALSILLHRDVAVTGAGRTDTGVNAIGYIAHFDSPQVLDTDQMRYKLNAMLPGGIVIDSISQVADDFHARFDATNREYTYFLHRVKDPFIENFSLFYPYALDFALMNRAAALMVGTHDFSCFEKVGGDNKTSICTVTQAAWQPYVPTHVALMGGGDAGDGQLRSGRLAALGSRGRGPACWEGPAWRGELPAKASVPAGDLQLATTFCDSRYAASSRSRIRSSAIPAGCNPQPAGENTTGHRPVEENSAFFCSTGQSFMTRRTKFTKNGELDSTGNSTDYWYFRIGADRFLRNMVRATVGTLIDVGRGKRSIDEFRALLNGGTRCDAGESVPGKALFLSKVEY